MDVYPIVVIIDTFLHLLWCRLVHTQATPISHFCVTEQSFRLRGKFHVRMLEVFQRISEYRRAKLYQYIESRDSTAKSPD